MKLRVVLDANVIISGILGSPRKQSRPYVILRRCLSGDFALVTSPYIVGEAYVTVGRPWFVRRNLTSAAREVIAELESVAVLVDLPDDIPRLCRDPKDDAVIATAVVGNASFLVTGDDDLLVLGAVEGVRVVDPANFIALLDAEADASPADDRN